MIPQMPDIIPHQYKTEINTHQEKSPECKLFTIYGLQNIKKEKLRGVYCINHKKFITPIKFLSSKGRRKETNPK